ncbi:MAG TPA: hypothetical protein VN495_02590, partial [Candidatus Paceibacterota bacterium]|nr:hypothetical protein [Candidatus Paceibacterota bacterium]
HLRQTQAIYAQNTSLKPGADLAAAIEAAAAATTGGVDADGLPVLHPDLMVQIEFETYARLVPKKEEKQAA